METENARKKPERKVTCPRCPHTLADFTAHDESKSQSLTDKSASPSPNPEEQVTTEPIFESKHAEDPEKDFDTEIEIIKHSTTKKTEQDRVSHRTLSFDDITILTTPDHLAAPLSHRHARRSWARVPPNSPETKPQHPSTTFQFHLEALTGTFAPPNSPEYRAKRVSCDLHHEIEALELVEEHDIVFPSIEERLVDAEGSSESFGSEPGSRKAADNCG